MGKMLSSSDGYGGLGVRLILSGSSSQARLDTGHGGPEATSVDAGIGAPSIITETGNFSFWQ